MRPLGIVVLLGLLWLAGLGWPTPHRTEGLRVAVGATMATNGNWVVPYLWGEPIFTKPPGFYWSLAAIDAIWPGDDLPGYRLVSVIALLGIGVAAIVFWRALQPQSNDPGLGAWTLTTLLVLPCSLGAMGQLPSVEMDLAFSFWVVAFWLVLLLWGTRRVTGSGVFLGLLVGTALGMLAGMAILFKWTAPSFFAPAGVWYLWRSRHGWAGKLLFCLPLFLFTVGLPAAWFAAVANQQGLDALIEALRAEALPHLSPTHHTRSYPFSEWITYPIQVCGMSLPAALPLVLWRWHHRNPTGRESSQMVEVDGVVGETGSRLQEARWGFWFVLAGSLVFWTLVPGHRPRHGLPIALGLVVLALPHWVSWIGLAGSAPGSRLATDARVVRALAWTTIVLFGLCKGVASLGGSTSRATATRLASQAGLIRLLHREFETRQGPSPLHLGGLKDDGFVFLTGLQAIRWQSERTPDAPGTYLLGKAFGAFSPEAQGTRSGWMVVPLLDQQGDPLYLVQIRDPQPGSP